MQSKKKFDDLMESPEFLNWFWDIKRERRISSNGEKFIRYLNSAPTGTNKIRYEEHGPHIYAIILKGLKLHIEVKPEDDMTRFTLVKVGFTQQNTSSDNPSSRINLLKEEIKTTVRRIWKAKGWIQDEVEVDCTVLFCLSIDALEVTPFFALEDEIRNKTGIELPKNIAKALGLPVPTEWIITTNKYTNGLKGFKDDLKKQRKKLRRSQGKPPNTGRQSTASAEAAKPTPESAASPSGSQDPDNLAAAIGNMTLEDSMIDTGKITDWMEANHKKYVLDASPGVPELLKVIGKYKPDEILIEKTEQEKSLLVKRSKREEQEQEEASASKNKQEQAKQEKQKQEKQKQEEASASKSKQEQAKQEKQQQEKQKQEEASASKSKQEQAKQEKLQQEKQKVRSKEAKK